MMNRRELFTWWRRSREPRPREREVEPVLATGAVWHADAEPFSLAAFYAARAREGRER